MLLSLLILLTHICVTRPQRVNHMMAWFPRRVGFTSKMNISAICEGLLATNTRRKQRRSYVKVRFIWYDTVVKLAYIFVMMHWGINQFSFIILDLLPWLQNNKSICLTFKTHMVHKFIDLHYNVSFRIADVRKLIFLCKNIVRHTARTIISWLNPKQWLTVHTSDLMIIIRYSTHSHRQKTTLGKLRTHSPIHWIQDN